MNQNESNWSSFRWQCNHGNRLVNQLASISGRIKQWFWGLTFVIFFHALILFRLCSPNVIHCEWMHVRVCVRFTWDENTAAATLCLLSIYRLLVFHRMQKINNRHLIWCSIRSTCTLFTEFDTTENIILIFRYVEEYLYLYMRTLILLRAKKSFLFSTKINLFALKASVHPTSYS